MALNNGMRPVHPGEILREELQLNLQQTYELRRAELAVGQRIAECVRPRGHTAA